MLRCHYWIKQLAYCTIFDKPGEALYAIEKTIRESKGIATLTSFRSSLCILNDEATKHSTTEITSMCLAQEQ